MIIPGQELELLIEKPAAGGRMIARHEGQIVFVLGAIPGERVLARIERVERQLAFGVVASVLEASPDRRPGFRDPLCGGCVYSHIGYARQLSLKGDVITDAFFRLGRIPLAGPVQVAASPEQGYRMRARFHVQGTRVGFFGERSHIVCDALPTGQVSEATVRAVTSLAHALQKAGAGPTSLEVSENMAGDQRAVYVEVAGRALPDAGQFPGLLEAMDVTGAVVRSSTNLELSSGIPSVGDPLERLIPNAGRAGELRRRPQSFFQANRFLLPGLVSEVVGATPPDGPILDLYAGVGLFSVALAASGRTGITAVEGSRTSAGDLRANAAAFAATVRVHAGPVETFLVSDRSPAQTIIVDPPRSGISRDAMTAVAARGARRVIYVSCDPATMARDARRLLDAGYHLDRLEALDLFPNTPHVETVAVFDQAP